MKKILSNFFIPSATFTTKKNCQQSSSNQLKWEYLRNSETRKLL